MRLVLLGAPRPPNVNRWKDDLADGAAALGWDAVHVEAKDVPTDEVVRLCRRADALLWLRTHRSDPAGDARAMLRRIEDAGTVTVGVHMDLYWSLPHRERTIGVHPWWTCQYVFTADGGTRDWSGRGVNHYWLPPAVSPHALGRGQPSPAMPHPVVFVGDCVPRIHGPHRRALLGWAERRYGDGFLRYGRHRPIWGGPFADLCASAHVVLGDSAPADRYWSDRVPLSLARGAVLAHPRTPGMAGQGFTAETMLPWRRGGFEALGEQVDNLTARERRQIGDNAIDLVRSRHTWDRRLERIAQVVFGAGDHRVRREPEQVGQLPERAKPSSAGAA